mmetsp:Transcript_8981/g.29669  ORF Transcript_8981/g.29669 Transcript_8981/m.29669 type:complete len:220 (-) Transcript_8981:84-743(-)
MAVLQLVMVPLLVAVLLLAPLLPAVLTHLHRREAQHRVALLRQLHTEQFVVASHEESAVEESAAAPLLLGRGGHALRQGAKRVARRSAGRLVRLALLLEAALSRRLRLSARTQLAAAHRSALGQRTEVGGGVSVEVLETVAGVGGGVGACLTPARDPVEARFDARRGILCSRDEAHPGELNPRGRTALLVGRCGDGAAEVAVVVGEWVAARRRDDGCRW